MKMEKPTLSKEKLSDHTKSLKFLIVILLFFTSCLNHINETTGHTIITKWPDNKRSAISITYDDGIINQLTVARPIMNKLGLPGTFYIITGKVKGSGQGKFIGRPAEEIIKETATIKTDSTNFFERASYIAYSGTTEAVEYHSNVGSLFESGSIDAAYKLLDEGYKKLREGELKDTDKVVFHNNAIDSTSWAEYKYYASEGHEIASHTVTHARLAVLDEPNLLYELKQSKADIEEFLGEEYTFSAECPYGTENERVMEFAHKVYPSLRNRMPEPYLDELNRSSKRLPNQAQKEYVQWQRGPLTNVTMETMKSWVDTCINNDNIWLVLVFHGINGVGWEPRTDTELEEYFTYIKERTNQIWVATFADVTKYIRQRKNSMIQSELKKDRIEVTISNDLDPKVYDIPLSLKTYVPEAWNSVLIEKKLSKGAGRPYKIQRDSLGSFVLYELKSDENIILLKPGEK
jgi:peptidoglycan/xylan/chitin deacetylase (PgdA/CDA1 family)